jgi:4-amino-4-deoxy-L-arabinose transferase-like glycosyltransferase
MLDKKTSSSKTLCTFRAHSWIVRLVAAILTVTVILRILALSGGSSADAGVVIVLLFALGVLIPVALLVWDHRRGVHVREGGILSVGANGSKFLSWKDLASFEIDAYIAGTIAIFAVCGNGSRLVLSDTARWRYQRRSVEQIMDELVRYRSCGLGTKTRRP